MPATPQSTTITNTIVNTIENILVANGYHTDIGQRVYKGRDAQYQGDDVTRPYVSVICISDGPSGAPRKQEAREREYSIEVTLNAGDDYHETQDQILWDLIKAFSYRTQSRILNGTAQQIELGDTTLDGPEPGSDKALVVLPLTVIYVDQFD